MRHAIALTLALGACAHHDRSSAPIGQNRELNEFAAAAAFPNAEDAVVLVALQQFLAAGREREGLQHFDALADAQPDRPLLRGVVGLLQLRLAYEVPLVRRVRWVEEGMAALDAGAKGSPLLGRYLRGLGFAALPERFDAAELAIADLEHSLAYRGEFPFDPDRGIYDALARAHATLGHDAKAAELREQSGETGRHDRAEILGNISVDPRAGYRFCEPRLVEEADGVFVAEGYDMSNIAFIVDREGVIAIDAGATELGAKAALAALRDVTDAPIRMIVLTHAHWDHIGGIVALRGPDTQVLGSAGFDAELARVRAFHPPYRWFFAGASYDVTLDRVIAKSETLELGALEVKVFPAHSGETADALFVELPSQRLLFVGDAFMPYVGSPFAGEGSPEGYLAAITEVRRIAPRKLIHGHPPLTRYFTVEAMAGLEPILQATYRRAREAANHARPLGDVLGEELVPAALAAHPASVQPFFVIRDNFIAQVMRQHGGRWATDGVGVQDLDRREWAATLDLLADARPRRFARTIDRLLARGDAPLAFEVASAALARHPDNRRLGAAHARAASELRERYQTINPFRFIVYSELGNQPLPPVDVR